MKLPFLPIVFDNFTSSFQQKPQPKWYDGIGGGNEEISHTASPSSSTSNMIYFLSHFHTDHLKGLSSSWGLGYRPSARTIYCSRITKALLALEYGTDLEAHVVALPMFRWVDIAITSTYHIRCCLLPACHMTGSVQILLDTFLGKLLYTGDVKATPALLRVIDAVAQRVGGIDHVYLDDTWLHLDRASGPLCPTENAKDILRRRENRHRQQQQRAVSTTTAEELSKGISSDLASQSLLIPTWWRSASAFESNHHHTSYRTKSAVLGKLLSDEQLTLAFTALQRRVAPLVAAYRQSKEQQQQRVTLAQHHRPETLQQREGGRTRAHEEQPSSSIHSILSFVHTPRPTHQQGRLRDDHVAHLSPAAVCPSPPSSSMLQSSPTSLHKLLEAEEESPGRLSNMTALDYDDVEGCNSTTGMTHTMTAAAQEQRLLMAVAQSLMWRPYALRFYLHNHFGKEVILQRLAEMLGTRILVDDERYRRLEAVAATFTGGGRGGCGSEGGGGATTTGEALEEDKLTFMQQAKAFLDWDAPFTNDEYSNDQQQQQQASSSSLWSPQLQDDLLACWRVDVVDLRWFIPHSRLSIACKSSYESSSSCTSIRRETNHHHADDATSKLGSVDVDHSSSGGVGGVLWVESPLAPAYDTNDRVDVNSATPPIMTMPCIEVVHRRSLISVGALKEASAPVVAPLGDDITTTNAATPHFGIVFTGWAMMQSRKQKKRQREEGGHEEEETSMLLQLPYTMHSTPSELADLIAVLGPKSVTPLHYRREQGSLVTSRLGALLHAPYVNAIVSASALQQCAVPLSLRSYIYGGMDSSTAVVTTVETGNSVRADGASESQLLESPKSGEVVAAAGLVTRRTVGFPVRYVADNDDDAHEAAADHVLQQQTPSKSSFPSLAALEQMTLFPSNASAAPVLLSKTVEVTLSQLAEECTAADW